MEARPPAGRAPCESANPCASSACERTWGSRPGQAFRGFPVGCGPGGGPRRQLGECPRPCQSRTNGRLDGEGARTEVLLRPQGFCPFQVGQHRPRRGAEPRGSLWCKVLSLFAQQRRLQGRPPLCSVPGVAPSVGRDAGQGWTKGTASHKPTRWASPGGTHLLPLLALQSLPCLCLDLQALRGHVARPA